MVKTIMQLHQELSKHNRVKSGRNWYYVDTDGKMVTGDYIIDGKVNYFDNQGLWMNKMN